MYKTPTEESELQIWYYKLNGFVSKKFTAI